MRHIIAIHGLMGSGKSSVASLLDSALVSVTKPFARPIKDFAYKLGWDGVKDKKGRKLLQTLGTEVGRECIDDLIWVKKWQAGLEDTGSNVTVICDDLRFQNEYAALCEMSKDVPVTIIHIKRPKSFWSNFKPKHASERGINFNGTIKPYMINNVGTMSDLKLEVERFVHEYL